MTQSMIPLPLPLAPRLPTIEGNVDYHKLRQEVLRIDELLLQSGIEEQFIRHCVQQWLARARPAQRKVSAQAQLRYQIHCRRALRCNLLRTYLQEDFRGLAARLADSPLFQYFCGLSELDKVKVPAKSTLQRYAHWIEESALSQLIDQVLGQAHQHPRKLQLTQPVDLEACFVDTTCLEAHIHYPVDWVLLRDATRTLMKRVQLIRRQGLRHRMEEPALFLKRMNRLCLEMTHTGAKTDSQRHRKKVLRKMDKLVGSVARHAKRYRQLLDLQWEKTSWTRPQAEQVLRGLDDILSQLPAARRQARQRLIQGEPVANQDKILSLYDPAVRVIVRNKAGVKVEFGNTLLLAEGPQGLILDWELFEQTAPDDSALLQPTVERIQAQLQIQIKELAADRRFDSAKNRQWLAQQKIFNGICPRDPKQLRQRVKSWKFLKLQTRRSQTEGRISIVIHNFVGSPLRCKGFAHRELAVGWGVLTHNLWVLARLPKRVARRKNNNNVPALRQAA